MAAIHFRLLSLYVFGIRYSGQFQHWLVFSRTDLITRESLNVWLTLLRLMVRVTCLIRESDQEDWPWLYSLFLFNSFMILIITYIGDYFYFYLFFEISMGPVYIIIFGWGGRSRLEAAYKILYWTLVLGGPLIAILYCYKYGEYGHGNIINVNFDKNYPFAEFITYRQKMGWWWVAGGFLVKIPVFIFHGWLPLAHSNASLSGSMLLAGMLIKLGILGIFRFASVLYQQNNINSFLIILCIWGFISISLTCVITRDLKTVVAYRSIVHMALIIVFVVNYGLNSKALTLFISFTHAVTSIMIFLYSFYQYQLRGTKHPLFSSHRLRIDAKFVGYILATVLGNRGLPPFAAIFWEVYAIACSSIWCFDIFFLVFLGLLFVAAFHIFPWVIFRKGVDDYLNKVESQLTLDDHRTFIYIIFSNFCITGLIHLFIL